MGTVSQFHDNMRQAARRIESEEEAIATARRLAADFNHDAIERDINRIIPYTELDALSQSGLAAIAVPPDHQGLDVSNAMLAEIVAIIAEGDASIGEFLEGHFSALEALRTQAGEELKAMFFARVLAGDRFAMATSGEKAMLRPEAPGYLLNGPASQSPGILYADWIALSGIEPSGRQLVLYLQSDSEAVRIIDDWDGFGQRTNGSATAIVDSLHINADMIVGAPPEYATSASLRLLLKAGVALGIARAAFTDILKADMAPDAGIGRQAMKIETSGAAIERAGRKLDIAQVNPTDKAMEDAHFSASAAYALASETALATAGALFDLSGTRSASIALNLDRHWRNARIHAMPIATEALEHAAGEYSLKLNV